MVLGLGSQFFFCTGLAVVVRSWQLKQQATPESYDFMRAGLFREFRVKTSGVKREIARGEHNTTNTT